MDAATITPATFTVSPTSALQDLNDFLLNLCQSTPFDNEQVMHLRGANFKVQWRLAKSQAPTHAMWKGRGPARSHAETEYRLSETADGGTRFDYSNEFENPGGAVGRLAGRRSAQGRGRRGAPPWVLLGDPGPAGGGWSGPSSAGGCAGTAGGP